MLKECGRGTVGRGVASDTRGLGFGSSHQQFWGQLQLLQTVEQSKRKSEKKLGKALFEKMMFFKQLTVNVQYKFSPMTGFEPQTSRIGSDRSTN